MQKNLILLILFFSLSIHLSAQKVGIGTNTPSEKLEVNGNIKADSGKYNALKLSPNAGSGKILTSDATGNASWQDLTSAGNAGYGAWGDCATNANISAFHPVADTTGTLNAAFGISVSISGNFAIIGAYGEAVGNNAGQGVAVIYQFDGSKWVPFQKISDPNGAAGDWFGKSVSIWGNYAIVGSPMDDFTQMDQGSACIFFYNGVSWTYVQKLYGGSSKFFDNFGNTVCISETYAIVGASGDDLGGAPGDEYGSATIFKLNGATWSFNQKISDPTGSIGDNFGFSVSISGNYAVIGSYRDDIGANVDQGSASIYSFSGFAWILAQKVTGPIGAAGDFFGSSVSVSGNDVVIGAYKDQVSSNIEQGSAFVFHKTANGWSYVQQLIDPDGSTDDHTGYAVHISGNYVLVGSVTAKINGNANQGAILIYKKMGSFWQRIQKLTDPGFDDDDRFGNAVSVDGTSQRFVVGASSFLDVGKAVFGKIN